MDESQQPWPLIYVYQTINSAVVGETLILNGNLAQPAGLLVEAIDLTDETLTNGNSALVIITGSPISTATAEIFRGFTYANSQGTYAWRGSAILVPGNQLQLFVNLGSWSVSVTARVIPEYAIFPQILP